MRAAIALVAATVVGLLPAIAPAQASPPAAAIEEGATVSIEYTLSDDRGKVIDSNQGRPPLTFVQGAHQIVPGLERALAGMRAGEEKRVTVLPADGYGEVDPTAVAEIPKEMVPADARVAGTELVARSPQGATRLVVVKEVREQTVVLDLNHPLAGKTLYFLIKVLVVEIPAKR
jgi:FKBP-type peptidyl-prolyl cis-trans isomerase SlyD